MNVDQYIASGTTAILADLPKEGSEWSYTNPSRWDTFISFPKTIDAPDQSKLQDIVKSYEASGVDLSKVQIPVVVSQIKDWMEVEVKLKNSMGAFNIVNAALDDARTTITNLTVSLKDSEEYALKLEEKNRKKGSANETVGGPFRGGTGAG